MGQHIFRHCIRGALKGKTRILVTHHVHLLPKCDLVVILEDGRVKAQGTYQELQKSGIDISAFVPASDENDIELDEEDEVEEEAPGPSAWVDSASKASTNVEEKKFEDELGSPEADESEPLVGIPGQAVTRQQSANIEDVVELSKEAEMMASERRLDKRSSQIMSIEEKNTGDVTTSVYSYYIRSGGVGLFVLVLLGLISSQGAMIGAQFQLAAWGSKSATEANNGTPLSSQENLYQLVRFYLLRYLYSTSLAVLILIVYCSKRLPGSA